jgi:hypothetical protein
MKIPSLYASSLANTLRQQTNTLLSSSSAKQHATSTPTATYKPSRA